MCSALRWYCLLAFVLISGWTVPLSAGPIGLNTWYEFGFDPNHAPSVAGCGPADPTGVPCRAGVNSTPLDTPPWTFVAASPVQLTATDAFLPGDSFDIFDSGKAVGSTPSVPISGVSCGLDPSICLADPDISHATFFLPGGPHAITIDVHAAQLLGEGFFRVAEVPEPSTFGLTALVLASLYAWRKRCRPRGVSPARNL
jgi:PEP-CTERM motif